MKNTEKGFALPLALLLLVVMTLMGAVLVSITVGDIRANNEKDYSQQAFYAAESGITHAKKWMKTNTTCRSIRLVLSPIFDSFCKQG